MSLDANRIKRKITLFVTNSEGRRVAVELLPDEAVSIGTSLISVGKRWGR